MKKVILRAFDNHAFPWLACIYEVLPEIEETGTVWPYKTLFWKQLAKKMKEFLQNVVTIANAACSLIKTDNFALRERFRVLYILTSL